MTQLKMWSFSAWMVSGRAWTMMGRSRAAAHGVEHQRQRADVVKVGVREKDVVDAAHVLDGQVLDAGAGIDQDVVVDEEG